MRIGYTSHNLNSFEIDGNFPSMNVKRTKEIPIKFGNQITFSKVN